MEIKKTEIEHRMITFIREICDIDGEPTPENIDSLTVNEIHRVYFDKLNKLQRQLTRARQIPLPEGKLDKIQKMSYIPKPIEYFLPKFRTDE